MHVRKTLTQWALATLFAAVSFAQTTTLSGKVTGEDGKPIQGAEVKITRTDIKANYSVKTNKDGKYAYATLPLGTFDVQWLVNGQVVYQLQKVRTNYANPTEIDVDLAKLKQQQQAAAAGAPPAPPPGVPPAGQAPKQQTEAEKKAEAEARAKYEKEMNDYEAAQKKNAALQGSFNAGVEAAKAKNYDAAIEAFNKAGEADPKQDAVWAHLGEVYETRGAARKGAERLADYKDAASNYQKAIDLKPVDADYRYHASVAYARSNNMDEATAQLEKGVSLDPTQAARGYTNLGNVYFETNRADAAEKAYRKAIEIDPNAPNGYMGLGRTLIQKASEENGKLVAPAGTAEAFQKYLALAPTGAEADEAKAMLEALGATISNSVGSKAAPAKPAAKGKGK
jgi:tetratricopeptide (TPR) repeat protein